MNVMALMRFACRMSALVALFASLFSVAVEGSPSAYRVPVGESRVYRLATPISRVAVGNPEVADYLMITPSELYLLGKQTGVTNLVLWDRNGHVSSAPLYVSRNLKPIEELLRAVLPDESDIRLYATGPALVLGGTVSDALAAETASRVLRASLGGSVPEVNPETTLTERDAATPVAASIASPSGLVLGGGSSGGSSAAPVSPEALRGVVNLLQIRDPQQVRLEVRIAEVSRSCMQVLGLGLMQGSGSVQGSLMTGFVSNATLNLLFNDATLLQADGECKKGVVKILAEPTIVAMSGKEGYFLVGGKVYTPSVAGDGAIDYVERVYGVGLRCTPTVLDGGRILLRVAPEVSEPLKEAVTAGTTTALPSFKMSYASTTVQMNEGENLVIGGLLRDNLTEVIRAIPVLGHIPVLGALFRHTERSSETTEIVVVVRPTLVKASVEPPELPTDRFVPSSEKELFIDGKLECGSVSR